MEQCHRDHNPKIANSFKMVAICTNLLTKPDPVRIQRFDGVPGVRQWGGAASCAQWCPERAQNLNQEFFRPFSPICVASLMQLMHVKTSPSFPYLPMLVGSASETML